MLTTGAISDRSLLPLKLKTYQVFDCKPSLTPLPVIAASLNSSAVIACVAGHEYMHIAATTSVRRNLNQSHANRKYTTGPLSHTSPWLFQPIPCSL